MCVQAVSCEAAPVQSVWFEAWRLLVESVVSVVWLETLSVWTEVHSVLVTEVKRFVSL